MRGELQGVMYAREDTLGHKEGEVVAFVRAIGRAESLIRQDPTRMRALLKQYDSNMSDASIDKLFEAYLPALPNQARVGVASYEKAVAFHRAIGYITGSGNNYGDVVASYILDRALR
jgi:hypothetical protein